jgi:hypothetical protein
MKRILATLAVIIVFTGTPSVSQTVPKTCDKGQYLTEDGRCLKDRTGESMPAGDGCNTATCMSPNCRQMAVTAMYCGRGDDPATPAPEKSLPSIVGGITFTGGLTLSTSSGSIIPGAVEFMAMPSSEPSCPANVSDQYEGRCHVKLRFADMWGSITVVCRALKNLDNGWTVVDCSWKPVTPPKKRSK